MIARLMILMNLIAACCLAEAATEGGLSPNQQILEGRFGHNDKRYESFLQVMDLIQERGAKVLVETGTARDGATNFWGDGGSTILYAEWAAQNEATLYTVDISPQAIARAKDALTYFENTVHFVCSDSIAYLADFDQPIDFLYLDSYDFDVNNPSPSQNHHLYEIQAAYDKLHADSVVMIDDCTLPFGGKGKLVIKYLLEKGWKIVYDGYQVILVQN